jgi:hypothetical protein
MNKRAIRYLKVALLAEIVGVLSLYGTVALSGRLFAGENQFWTRACLPEHMISSPHLGEYGRLKTAGVCPPGSPRRIGSCCTFCDRISSRGGTCNVDLRSAQRTRFETIEPSAAHSVEMTGAKPLVPQEDACLTSVG